MRVRRAGGLPEYFKVKSEKKCFDEIVIKAPDETGQVSIWPTGAEYESWFSLEQVKEIRDDLNEILKGSGIE